MGILGADDNMTIKRKNETTIDGNVAYVALYNNKGEQVTQSTIDADDVEKVSVYQWRLSKKRDKLYVVAGNSTFRKYLHNLILDYEFDGVNEVDHIDGNSLNNRKNNLRKIPHSLNCKNVKPRKTNKLGIRGVSYSKRDNNYLCDFICGSYRLFLKPFKDIESAVYLRYLCETTFLNEYRNTSNDKLIFSYINKLTNEQKNKLKQYFQEKISTIEVTVHESLSN